MAGYLQDDIRVTPRLTLNFGLRYEMKTPVTERRRRANLPGRLTLRLCKSMICGAPGASRFEAGDHQSGKASVRYQMGTSLRIR
jgi:outer membrane receptor protein involved in Fe transport